MHSILKTYHPDCFKSLSDLAKVTMKEGALSTKIKELMAVVLSISAACEQCVKIHARRALQHRATKEEIAETIGVAVLLLGGPADVCPSKIIEEEIQKYAN